LATYPRALRLSYSLLNGDRRDVCPCSFFSIVFFGGIIINGGVRAGAGASPDGAKNRLILKTNAYWRPSTSYVLYLSRNNTALAAEGKDLDSVLLLLSSPFGLDLGSSSSPTMLCWILANNDRSNPKEKCVWCQNCGFTYWL
jgi:hypothetical protein